MSRSKKAVFNLSNIPFTQLNSMLQNDYIKRSKFIREIVILYIRDINSLSYETMKKGYIEMAQLNLELCNFGFESDMKNLKEYEAMLSESDFPNDTHSKKRRYILC